MPRAIIGDNAGGSYKFDWNNIKTTEIATDASWKTQPIPEKTETFNLDWHLTETEMTVLSRGHMPRQMEDHWFMYYDGSAFRFYRSWSGLCIYVAKVEQDECGYRITNVTVNRDQEQYQETCIKNDKIRLEGLVQFYLCDNKPDVPLVTY